MLVNSSEDPSARLEAVEVALKALPSVSSLGRDVGVLEDLAPELQSLKAEAGGLSSAISRTFRMASGISEKVRKLDVEQQRLQETLALLDSISDMKRAASQARTAMETRNYDTAAHSVATFLAQDPRLIQTVFLAHPGPPSPEMGLLNFRLEDGSCPAQILKEIQTKLHQILQESLDNAIKVMDKPAMVSHLKLFPLIGYPQTGLERLLRYLCGIVSRQCQDGLKTATEAIASGASTTTQRQVYVDLLTRLYESIALIIDQQTGLVESIFGKENHPVATMILSLKKEADKQSSLFIDSFCDYRALKRRIHGIKEFERYSFPQHQPSSRSGTPTNGVSSMDQSAADPLLDLRQLDGILTEIASIGQKHSLFENFIKTRLVTARPEESRRASLLLIEPNERVSRNMNELVTYFITMQDYYVKQSVQKALAIDEKDPSSLTSSCVDDVFFIMKTSCRRSVTTLNPNIFISSLSSISMCLDQEFLNYLTTRLHSTSGMIENKEGRSQFIVLLNNLDVSCEYILKLAKDVDSDAAFKDHPESLAKIRSALSSMNEEAASFRNVLRSWNENLFNQILKPRIKPILMQAFGGDVKYILSEEEYAEQQSLQSFLNRFVAGMSKLTGYYKKTLTETNYNQVFISLVEHLFKEWEKHILTLRFNLLGATRFDEDLRSVTAYLATLTDWSFRDKFARLSQMSTILGLETLSEIFEYWGPRAGPMVWKWKAAEVRKILCLRVEFNAEAVAKLKL